MAWEVVALSGPDRERRWPIGKETVTFGRGDENDVRLNGLEVSREHFAIDRKPKGGLSLRVLPSARNETSLNGKPIARGEGAPLEAGDQIRVGTTVLEIRRKQAAGAQPLLTLSDQPEDVNLTRVVCPATMGVVGLVDQRGDRDRRLAALIRLVETLARAGSVDELYDRALECMFEVLGPDRGFVADYIEETGEFRRVHGRAREGVAPDTRMSRSLLDHARGKKSASLFQREGEIDLLRSPSCAEIGIRDFMCVPFFTGEEGERFEGIFYFDSTTCAEPRFTEEDLQFVAAGAQIFSRCLESLRLRTELRAENEQLIRSYSTDHSLIGSSQAMRELMRRIERYGPMDAPILITGETGTGKEVIARAIHRRSGRCACPFVAFNCGAIARNLVEAELFGAEKGAFTGCDRQIKGKFELADSGILFLDEIGELPLEIQAAFLRVLEGQEFYRLGGQQPLTVNVRLIAATNRDLETLIKGKTFREDLFYRLAVLRIQAPPLRDREDDVIELAEAFLKRSGLEKSLSAKAKAALKKYPWPGNVRELRNVVERAIVNSSDKVISASDLDLPAGQGDQGFAFRVPPLAEVEKRHIEFVLERLEWNITQAATLLGINRQTLYDKIERYGLRQPE